MNAVRIQKPSAVRSSAAVVSGASSSPFSPLSSPLTHAAMVAPLRVDRIKVKNRSCPFLFLLLRLLRALADLASPLPPPAEFVPTCGPQFASMLACWATSGDLRNAGPCVEPAKLLTMCLKSPVRPFPFAWPSGRGPGGSRTSSCGLGRSLVLPRARLADPLNHPSSFAPARVPQPVKMKAPRSSVSSPSALPRLARSS